MFPGYCIPTHHDGKCIVLCTEQCIIPRAAAWQEALRAWVNKLILSTITRLETMLFAKPFKSMAL